jgi:hypothetical protein
VGLVLLGARPVPAQTQLCQPAPPFASPPPTAFTCYATLPFNAAFDASSPQAGDVYKVRIDGTQAGSDVPAVVGTTAVQLTVAGLPARAAAYVLTVGHVRPPLAEVLSAPVQLTLVPVPPPTPGLPGNLRIIAELIDAAGHVLARYLLMAPVPPAP